MKYIVILVIAAAVAGGGFLAYKSKLHQNSGKPVAVQQGNTGNKASEPAAKKQVVDCSIYEKQPDYNSAAYKNMPADEKVLIEQTMQGNNFVSGDRGNLPVGFPDVADRSKLCGSIKGFRATYYVTSLTDDELFKWMTPRLKAYGCDVEPPKHGKGSKYLHYMNFTCPGAKGLVGTDPTRFAYNIIYPATSGDAASGD